MADLKKRMDALEERVSRLEGGAKSSAKKSSTRKARKPSGFMKFSSKERKSVMAENPNIAFADVGRELGKRWRALSEAEKKKY
jgi:hypothetical protein